jgi:virginiamycin A acetyltransferase
MPMRKIFLMPFKVARRSLVWLCSIVLAAFVDSADRNHLIHWPFFSEALGMVPFTFGWQLRQETYRRLGVCRGTDVVLNHGTTIGDRRTTIGNDVWLGRDVYLEYADVADHVLIGPGSVLLAGARHHRTNNVDVPIKLQGNNPLAPIRIGEGVWIGANTTVMADVGRHAIVGAGAVVTKPVPDYAVVVGNPARIVRDRRQVTPHAIDDQKSEIVLTVDGASMAERVLE